MRRNLFQIYSCFSWFICKHKTENKKTVTKAKSIVRFFIFLFFFFSKHKCKFYSNRVDIGSNISISISGNGISNSSRCIQRFWLNWMWCWFLVFLFNNCSFLHSMRFMLWFFAFRSALFIYLLFHSACMFPFVVSFTCTRSRSHTHTHNMCKQWMLECILTSRY